MNRKLLGIATLALVIVVASGGIASTTSNQVPRSSADFLEVEVHFIIPEATLPQDDLDIGVDGEQGSDSVDNEEPANEPVESEQAADQNLSSE